MIEADLERLLAPVSADSPSGPDLSYDPDFLALEQASQGKSEQQFGDTVIAAEEPNWPEVKDRAEALLSRSKDLRAAVFLVRAWNRMHQIEGLATGLDLVKELLSRHWETLHPELDREDSDDPTMRLNALAPFADATGFLREIRNTSVVASPQHGRVAVRDILVAAGKLQPGPEDTLRDGDVTTILRAVSETDATPLQCAVRIAETVGGIEAFLTEKGVITQAPDLRPLQDVVSVVAKTCNAVLGAASGEEGAAGADATGGVAGVAVSGQIGSREEVLRILDKVCAFIEHSEPANPAPLLIRRAQRLIGRNFVELIEELAPEGLASLQKIAGLEAKESS